MSPTMTRLAPRSLSIATMAARAVGLVVATASEHRYSFMDGRDVDVPVLTLAAGGSEATLATVRAGQDGEPREGLVAERAN